MPKEWQAEILEALKQPDAPASVAAFIRGAIREKLDSAENRKAFEEFEERVAATFSRLTDILDRQERSLQSVQTHLALQETINKLILTCLPEPANTQAARKIGQERYARAVEFTNGDRR